MIWSNPSTDDLEEGLETRQTELSRTALNIPGIREGSVKDEEPPKIIR
jgi:hypothetical protein